MKRFGFWLGVVTIANIWAATFYVVTRADASADRVVKSCEARVSAEGATTWRESPDCRDFSRPLTTSPDFYLPPPQ